MLLSGLGNGKAGKRKKGELMATDYKCSICDKEFKNKWRLDNHECPGPVIVKVDLSSGIPAEPILVRSPVPTRIVEIVSEPNPILEDSVPLNSKKHSRDWAKEILAQTPKRLHKYL